MAQAIRNISTLSVRRKIAGHLALERNLSFASAAVLVIGVGEELWKKFLPKYLEALGAGPSIIGLFGSAQDFFDAIYQYPGGWLTDHLGKRRAFLVFVGLASMGYLVCLVSPSWPFLLIGLALVMTWQSMASPAIFALIGDSLPRARRAMGFTLQSILKRIPIVFAPIVGGVLIAQVGIVHGFRTALLITLVFAVVAIALLSRIDVRTTHAHVTNVAGVWRTFHVVLKRLLISDVIIRTCEGMTGC